MYIWLTQYVYLVNTRKSIHWNINKFYNSIHTTYKKTLDSEFLHPNKIK